MLLLLFLFLPFDAWLFVSLLFIKVEELANLWKVQNMVLFTDSSFGKENMFHLVAGLVTGWRDP